MAVDWTRMAAPQADDADTEEYLRQLRDGRYGKKALTTPAGALVWPDGRARWITAVEEKLMPSDEYLVLPPEDEIVQAGVQLLDLWPEVRRQSALLMVGICPLTAKARADVRGMGHGCSCGHFGDNFGCIYGTADDSWGFAEAIVHEMAHWKLRALGIWFEEWTDAVLAHQWDELYASPVRKDKPRPMGAVLHAQYSYVHVARMVTLALAQKEKPDTQDTDWAALQLSRITEGRGTLQTHAKGTEQGEAFLSGLDKWTGEVLADGQAIIDAAKARMTP